MKKTLIAAAVLAGLAGVAHAESSVTLYGTLDGGLGFSSSKLDNTLGVTFIAPDEATVKAGVGDTIPKAHALSVTGEKGAEKVKLDNADVSDSDAKNAYIKFFNQAQAANTHKVYKNSSFGVQEGVMSGNKFGLKGNEDLGNGINAIFQLEGKFSIVDGSIGVVNDKDDPDKVVGGKLFGSKAFLGLSSDAFGTLTAGNQGNAADELAPDDGGWANYDFFGKIATKATTGAPVVKYVSPDLQGFQFAFSWQGDNDSTKTTMTGQKDTNKKTHDNSLSLGLAYSLGNLSLNGVVTNENWKDKDDKKHKTTDFILGGTYDFGVAAVTARFGQTNAFGHSSFVFGTKDADDGAIAANETVGSKLFVKDSTGPVRVFGLALSAPVGANGQVFLNYQYATAKLKGAPAAYNNFNGKATGHAVNLAFQESLSKRTTVYAYAGYQVQKLKETYNAFGNGTSADKQAFAISQTFKATNSQFAIGLNHKF